MDIYWTACGELGTAHSKLRTTSGQGTGQPAAYQGQPTAKFWTACTQQLQDSNLALSPPNPRKSTEFS